MKVDWISEGLGGNCEKEKPSGNISSVWMSGVVID
jgi:hypothetical protein